MSIQAQIVNLFGELKEKLGLTYLFIAHDLSMVRHISDRVGVMYLGMMAEMADSRELYENPRHPYTKRPAFCDPQYGSRSAHERQTDPDGGRSGKPCESSGRMPVCQPLSVGH